MLCRYVLIFRDHLLPPSETFILAQGEALKEFTAYYVGSRFVRGLHTPPERTLVVNKGNVSGWFQEIVFKVTRFSFPQVLMSLRKLSPLLLQAHFGPGGAFALPLAQRLGLPLIVTYHGIDATIKDEFARRFFSFRLYLKRREILKREARLFIAVSHFIKDNLINQGFPEEKIVVHYIGVDTHFFTPDLSIPREPIVLFVGRLVEKKGCEYLIRAMTKVQTEMPEVELVVIGDGPLRSKLENMARELPGRWRFLGTQSQNVVREWMNRAMVFSVPSVIAESGDAEGFGLVFAEAQAMGLPVVSFATGGIPEAVAHGKTGFLAAEGDTKMLASYILQLLSDKELWQKFSIEGQKRVRQHFDLEKQTRKLEEIYMRVISEAQFSKKFR